MPSLRRSSLRRSGLAVLVGAWLLAMALPASVMAGSGRFVDDDGSRYESSIEAVARAGIMTACNPPKNDRFCPKADVSRGAMAVYLVRTFHLTATSGVRFRDVPGHGSKATAIDKVVTAGIAAGCSKRRFCPDAAVTRGRMAVFVTRALQADRNERRSGSTTSRAHPFATAINRLATAGLAISCGSHRFCPNRDISRAETAGFLQRARSITRVTAAQPAPGNPDGSAPVPPGAGAADTSSPDHVDRQRDAGELHLGGGRRAPSPRAASSPSTAARSRSRSRWPPRPRCSTTGPTSSSTAAAWSRSTARTPAGSCT